MQRSILIILKQLVSGRTGDFKTISIQDNLIVCEGLARPLLRSQESYMSRVENNILTREYLSMKSVEALFQNLGI